MPATESRATSKLVSVVEVVGFCSEMWSMKVGNRVVQARGTRLEVPVGVAEERSAVARKTEVMERTCILNMEIGLLLCMSDLKYKDDSGRRTLRVF